MANLVPKVPASVWVQTARDALIDEGVSGVKIDRLAQRLGVTRGGFYHHFADHAGLLAALLALWRESVRFVPDAPPPVGAKQALQRLEALAEHLIAEQGFDPRFDMAVRAWAHGDAVIGRALERADTQRIEALRTIFDALGCGADEAAVRARVFYFHQIGYYAIGIKESRALRRERLATYLSILVGDANLRRARKGSAGLPQH